MNSTTTETRAGRRNLKLSPLLPVAACLAVVGFAGQAAAHDVIHQEQMRSMA